MKTFLKNTVVLASILLLSLSLFPQNTGFMGKRFIFNADIAVNPAWLNPTFMDKNNNDWDEFSRNNVFKHLYHFNWHFSSNIEIIVWNKGTLGILAHYLTSYYTKEAVHNIYVPFSVTGCGVFYKHYFGESRAPIGNYIKLEFDVLLPTPKEPSDFLFYGAKIEFGKDFIFANCIKLSIAGNLGIPFTGWKNLTDFHNTQDITQRLMGVYWLGVKLGLGFIAF